MSAPRPRAFGRRRLLCGLLAFGLPLASPRLALALDAREFDQVVLPPGAFLWRPEEGEDGPVRIVVSLPLQTALVFRGESLVGASSVSSGRQGRRTPPGVYAILEKAVWHRSNLYEDAPMPFMQRLTWDGLALHAGRAVGRPLSHGCVRLPPPFAEALFGETRTGDLVVVTEEDRPSRVLEGTAVDALRLPYRGGR